MAPNGHDTASGTEASPFRTLERARDAARNGNRGDVTIMLRQGTYRLDEPLRLDARDSGRPGHDVVYRSAPAEHATISGATSVPPGSWSRVEGSPDIWQASVGHRTARQLYVNGRRATVAQTPPFPVGFLPVWSEHAAQRGIEYRVSDLNGGAWRDPTTWTNRRAIRAVVYDQWKMMSVPVAAITPPGAPDATGFIAMQQPGWDNANLSRDAKTGAPGIWGFWQVTRFENAYQFLDQPGEWYLDSAAGTLLYIPRPGEDMSTAVVELPRTQALVVARGTPTHPVTDLRFSGITFTGATWTAPNSADGYVDDQNGFHIVGPGHPRNTIGHDQHVVAMPGNLQFDHAHRIVFRDNVFEHLGAIGLAFGSGAQDNRVEDNVFRDISAGGIQLGDVQPDDAHPKDAAARTTGNTITGNTLEHLGREYVDTAAITVGFSERTRIEHNTITDVPWSGISMGWGWGLLDEGSFPGLPHASSGMWGTWSEPSQNRHNVIRANRIDDFLNVLWDGGAIYTTGAQAPDAASALQIRDNVAIHKHPTGGGNTFYTDGGSRHIVVAGNVSIDNPIGVVDFGPPPPAGDPLAYSGVMALADGQHYGSEIGGCVTYGDIDYVGNHWFQPPMVRDIAGYNAAYEALAHLSPYTREGFFDVCPYRDASGTSYPTNLRFRDNHVLTDVASVTTIVDRAGAGRPAA